jgi:hypothetical protein
MGPALAQTGLQGDCNRKSPGSAGHIFQKHRIASEAAKQHFADCGGVACLAGNAYYNPDLHTMPLLAERLFKAGKHDMCVPSRANAAPPPVCSEPVGLSWHLPLQSRLPCT